MNTRFDNNSPPEEEIPEYRVSYDFPNMEGLSGVFNTFGNIERNPKYYKERAEFLKVWGGSELITLKIFNHSEVLATGVEIEIRFPRIKGVSADNTKENFPVLPHAKTQTQFELMSPILTHTTVHYDIKRSHTNNEYCFCWEVGEVQANTHRISNTYIFLRSEKSIDIELTIFCDQLSSPIKEIYHLARSEGAVDVRITDLQSEDEEFIKLVGTSVMDGYIQRVAQRKLEEYEQESQEFLPRS